jgi:putative transposase
MKHDPQIHHRRTIRLREYDYSTIGAYFVTICTHGRECLFDEVTGGEMHLNDIGRLVEHVWLKLPEWFPHVALDEFVVMPNHFHGIICIVGAPLAAPCSESQEKSGGVKDKGAVSSSPTDQA